MTAEVDKLRLALFAATDGVKACRAINRLAQQANCGDERAKQALALYLAEGRIDHMRVHACCVLASSVKEPDAELAALFLRGLSDAKLRYWSILGYTFAAEKSAYAKLIDLTEDENLPLPERAHAIKCLASASKQCFDRDLPADPGYWKESDLRLSELRDWAAAGFPDGASYDPPMRDPALDHPTTKFERIVSRLDKTLVNKRQARQDSAEPTNWLAVASPDNIRQITARWTLPSTYLDFLTRFSPIRATLESEEFYNHLQIFGAGELIEGQDGYSFDPVKQQPIDDWPVHLVVIASHGGDPFVLDLSQSDGNDAPVETAEHGAGVWDFVRVANSFADFLRQLAKSCR